MTGIGHIPDGQPWQTVLHNSISLCFDFSGFFKLSYELAAVHYYDLSKGQKFVTGNNNKTRLQSAKFITDIP